MDDQLYMTRCLQLARLGLGKVAPNPMVGAVLVAEDRIIGEGFHKAFGKAHAEVNCLHSVSETDRHLIRRSTLYVSLEPCSHFGKTPPCTDLIISSEIPKVVIGTTDPFPDVNGKGIEKLKQAGVQVVAGVLEAECRALNKAFFHFHTNRRPYVILKWAQSADEMIAGPGPERARISNSYTDRLVHKWRSEVMAIMVGSNTVILDDPLLTTRHWPGKDPLRVVLDPNGVVDVKKKLLDGSNPTIIFTGGRDEERKNLRYIRIDKHENALQQVLQHLYELNIQTVMVEGGARLLQSFVDLGIWDEARVITNKDLKIGNGLAAPHLKGQELVGRENIGTDLISIYKKLNNRN